MPKKPYATVIINTVNEIHERLMNAIYSYKAQAGVDIQILISTVSGDDSIDVARKIGDVEVLINPNKGIYQQLNNAVKYIKGDWWCYASGNDIAHPTKIIQEINRCLKFNKKVCYSSYTRYNPESNLIITQNFEFYDYKKHLRGNFVSDCALMHTSLIKKYAPFRNELWKNDSFYDLWLRIYEGEGNIFCYNPYSTWTYFEYNDSKHLLRKKNPEELKAYADIRMKMIDSHIRPNINIKNTNMRITQCLTSYSLRFFEKSFLAKWDLKPYTDPKQAAVFFGVYNERDYAAIINHKSLAVVVWGGSDSMNDSKKLATLKLPHVHHISGSKWITDDLKRAGIDSTYIPISCVDSDKSNLKALPLGKKIYVYTSESNPAFYGSELYHKLMKDFGADLFYICTAKTYTHDELYNKIIPDSFVGLRLVKHDGLSETVAELGLMGRHVIYNGCEPNALNYKSYDDIKQHIKREGFGIGLTDISLHEKMKLFLNVGQEWLWTNSYK